MAKVTITFDSADMTPQNKYALLSSLAQVLDDYKVVNYDVSEGTEKPVNWSDFSDIVPPEYRDVADRVLDALRSFRP
jgi:hypothetical protein